MPHIASRYFSVDCIDAVDLIHGGRLVSKLISLDQKDPHKHTNNNYNNSNNNNTHQSYQTIFSRQFSKQGKAIKRPHHHTHSHFHASTKILDSNRPMVNYSTFEVNSALPLNMKEDLIEEDNGLGGSLKNSESFSSTSSKYLSNETLSQEFESEKKTKHANNKKAYDKNNYDNNNNFFKEQIGSVLKPTDKKLATKFFGNKGVPKGKQVVKKRSWLIHPRSTLRWVDMMGDCEFILRDWMVVLDGWSGRGRVVMFLGD